MSVTREKNDYINKINTHLIKINESYMEIMSFIYRCRSLYISWIKRYETI